MTSRLLERFYPILCMFVLALLSMTMVYLSETDVFQFSPINIECGFPMDKPQPNASKIEKHLFEPYDKNHIINALYETIPPSQIHKIIHYLHIQKNQTMRDIHTNMMRLEKPVQNEKSLINTTSMPQTEILINTTAAPQRPKPVELPLKSSTLPEIGVVNGKSSLNDTQLIGILTEQFPNETTFYNNLKTYRLTLMYGKPQKGGSYFSHPINRGVTIHRKQRTIGFWQRGPVHGFGNGLSVYWGSRALAFWMNYNWQMNSQLYYNSLSGETNHVMSAFLPHHKRITWNINDSLDATLYFMPGIDKGQHDVMHPTSLIFLWYNPYFQVIMHQEYMSAMHSFYEHTNRLETAKRMKQEMWENNDVVIHVRCGDVLQLMHNVKDWDYGFLTMNHYRYVITDGIEQIFGIHWHKDKINNDTTVWIISQLSNKSARKGEISAMKDCDYLINYIVDNALKDIFHPATVYIGYDSDVNDDYWRMLVAPLLICSPSTFCFNAGMGNMDGIVIIPNRGAWMDFRLVDEKYNETSDGLVVLAKSKLIPENQIIVDTERDGFHCNKID
eukprot:375101_1